MLTRMLLRLALFSRWPWLALLGYVLFAVTPWLVPVLVVAVFYGKWKQGKLPKVKFGGLMGSARLATLIDVLRAGAVGTGGIPLGVLLPPTFHEAKAALRGGGNRHACRVFWAWWRKRPIPVGLRDAVNVAIFSPTGAGKSTGFLIPWLLQNLRTTAVVFDPKGELFKATAAKRRKHGTVILLDPYGVTGEPSHTLNPIADLSWHDPLLVDKARQMADALVVTTGQERDPHWNASASDVLTAATVFQVALADSLGDPSVQTLGHVFALIADDKALVKAMEAMSTLSNHDGTAASLAQRVLGFRGEERGSVLSSAMRHLIWVNTPVTKWVTGSSSFDPAGLRGRTPVTVYMVIPPNAISEKKGLIRCWTTAFLRACVEAGESRHARVQFLLDEYAALGRLEVIENALTQMRGYGVRLYFAFQSAKQLERCFPDGGHDVFMANVTQIFCGVSDYPTAELVSKQIGHETVASYTFSGGAGDNYSYGPEGAKTGSYSTNDNWNASPHQRELFKPEEVMQLGTGIALTFTPGLPPLLTHPVKFFSPQYRRIANWSGGGVGLFVRSFIVFALSWGGLAAVAPVAIPAASAEIERQQREHRERVSPPGAPGEGWPQPGTGEAVRREPEVVPEQQEGEVVRDGLGQVAMWNGRPLVCPAGHHVEIDPRTNKAWVIVNGRRMFPQQRR